YRYARQGDLTPVTPHCNLAARKVPPQQYPAPHADLTFRLCAPYAARPPILICGAVISCDTSILFVNTTAGLIAMAFKLCQEGNREPLIQRVAFNALLGSLLAPKICCESPLSTCVT